MGFIAVSSSAPVFPAHQRSIRRKISHTCRVFSSRACADYPPLRPARIAAGEWPPAKG